MGNNSSKPGGIREFQVVESNGFLLKWYRKPGKQTTYIVKVYSNDQLLYTSRTIDECSYHVPIKALSASHLYDFTVRERKTILLRKVKGKKSRISNKIYDGIIQIELETFIDPGTIRVSYVIENYEDDLTLHNGGIHNKLQRICISPNSCVTSSLKWKEGSGLIQPSEGHKFWYGDIKAVGMMMHTFTAHGDVSCAQFEVTICNGRDVVKRLRIPVKEPRRNDMETFQKEVVQSRPLPPPPHIHDNFMSNLSEQPVSENEDERLGDTNVAQDHLHAETLSQISDSYERVEDVVYEESEEEQQHQETLSQISDSNERAEDGYEEYVEEQQHQETLPQISDSNEWEEDVYEEYAEEQQHQEISDSYEQVEDGYEKPAGEQQHQAHCCNSSAVGDRTKQGKQQTEESCPGRLDGEELKRAMLERITTVNYYTMNAHTIILGNNGMSHISESDIEVSSKSAKPAKRNEECRYAAKSTLINAEKIRANFENSTIGVNSTA